MALTGVNNGAITKTARELVESDFAVPGLWNPVVQTLLDNDAYTDAILTELKSDGGITTAQLADRAVTVPKLDLDGYFFREQRRYASNSNFSKSAYPWVRAVRVRVIGAGGSGGYAPPPSSGSVSIGAGGSGGGYAESFLTVDLLDLVEVITIGVGGAGTAGGPNNGTGSSFGTHVTAPGGVSGGVATPTGGFLPFMTRGGAAPSLAGYAGQILVPGQHGRDALGLHGDAVSSPHLLAGDGGGNGLGTGGGRGSNPNAGGRGEDATWYGGGGGGSGAKDGGTTDGVYAAGIGGGGLVILDLFE